MAVHGLDPEGQGLEMEKNDLTLQPYLIQIWDWSTQKKSVTFNEPAPTSVQQALVQKGTCSYAPDIHV